MSSITIYVDNLFCRGFRMDLSEALAATLHYECVVTCRKQTGPQKG